MTTDAILCVSVDVAVDVAVVLALVYPEEGYVSLFPAMPMAVVVTNT